MNDKPVCENGGMKEMLAIALPMVFSSVCDTVMVFTDRLFLARVDPEMMNASMSGGLAVFMLSAFFLGLIGYSTALVAQHLGAGRKKDCAVVVTQAVIFSLVAYPLILACGHFACSLPSWLGVGERQVGLQKVYSGILLYGAIISLLRCCLSGFFSGIGKTAIVTVASFTAMAVNVPLDYVLIFGKCGFPALGMAGAAYATVLGGLCGLLVLAAAYFRKTNRRKFCLRNSLRFDAGIARKLARFGSPAGAEMFLNLLAFNALVLIFHAHSIGTATAATIVFNWDMVSFVPLIGIEIGVTSLVGRYMGAQSTENAHRATMSGLKMGLVYSAAVMVVFALLPGYLVEVFRPAGTSAIFAASSAMAVSMVRIASLYVLAEAMLVVFIGALRGAGDTLWAMGVSVTLHWLMVGTLFFVLRVLGGSPQAGWVVVVFTFLLFSCLVYLRYQDGKWKTIRMVQKQPVMPVHEGFAEAADL